MLERILVSWWCIVIWTAKGAVLDPALYLSPSPPLLPISDSISPGKLWSQSRMERNADDLSVIPIELGRSTTKQTPTTTEQEQELMEKAETFWPSLRTTNYGITGIHIPLTFSVSGTYGGYGTGLGVIGSSYTSVSDDGPIGVHGKSGLAGSSYGSYSGFPGTRVYGGSVGSAWSGWGNGKWGHYGKG